MRPLPRLVRVRVRVRLGEPSPRPSPWPAPQAGALSTLPQLCVSSGILLSYVVGLVSLLRPEASWRLMLGLSLIPATLQATMHPSSPLTHPPTHRPPPTTHRPPPTPTTTIHPPPCCGHRPQAPALAPSPRPSPSPGPLQALTLLRLPDRP